MWYKFWCSVQFTKKFKYLTCLRNIIKTAKINKKINKKNLAAASRMVSPSSSLPPKPSHLSLQEFPNPHSFKNMSRSRTRRPEMDFLDINLSKRLESFFSMLFRVLLLEDFKENQTLLWFDSSLCPETSTKKASQEFHLRLLSIKIRKQEESSMVKGLAALS